MKTLEKQNRAAQVEAYWKKMEGNTERDVRRIERKFGLKFASYSLVTEDGHSEGCKMRRKDGLAVLDGVKTATGDVASFFYYV